MLNQVRSMPSARMLLATVELSHRAFHSNALDAKRCTGPVPPRVQVMLAKVTSKAQRYVQSVKWIQGTERMEALVSSQADCSKAYHVILPRESQRVPKCCAYSRMMDIGLPCYHGAAVVIAKHGPHQLHKFIHPRYLTTAWQEQYAGVTFPMLSQHALNDCMVAAQGLVAQGSHLRGTCAAVAPRGKGTLRFKSIWHWSSIR